MAEPEKTNPKQAASATASDTTVLSFLSTFFSASFWTTVGQVIGILSKKDDQDNTSAVVLSKEAQQQNEIIDQVKKDVEQAQKGNTAAFDADVSED